MKIRWTNAHLRGGEGRGGGELILYYKYWASNCRKNTLDLVLSTDCRGPHFNFRHVVNGEHGYIFGVMNGKLMSQFIVSKQVVCINMGFSVTIFLTTPNFGIQKSLVLLISKISFT